MLESVDPSTASRDSLFEANEEFGEGGALFLYVYEKDTVLLENNTVIDNIARPDSSGNANGGGLRGSSNGILIIRNTTFANNQANQGGGLWVAESLAPVTIENSTFSGNTATGGDSFSQGAAMAFINNTQTVNITHATIISNTADFSNGAFFGIEHQRSRSRIRLLPTTLAQPFQGGKRSARLGMVAATSSGLRQPAMAHGSPLAVA